MKFFIILCTLLFVSYSCENGGEFYVSPPLKSTHFDGNNQLINITSTINGLKGTIGVWKRK